MKKLLGLGVVLLLVGAGVFAYFKFFKGSDKHLQLVPKNAMVVGTIDLKSLAQKADIKKIMELSWVKDMQKESAEKATSSSDKEALEVLKNPLSSGVNVMSDVYFFAQMQGTQFAGGLVFDIKDEAAFEATVKKIDSAAKIVTGDGYKVVVDGDGSMDDAALAWSSTGGIVAFVSEREEGNKNLNAFLTETFKRTKDESILVNATFKKFVQGKKDASLFIDGNEVYTAVNQMGQSAMSSMNMSSFNNAFKDTYYWSNLDFQQDKILVTTHVESNNKDYEKFQVLSPKGISADHAATITNKNVYALIAMSLDRAKLTALYDQVPEIKQGKEGFAASLGMTPKELEDIFGGELSIALVDFTAPQTQSQDEAPVADPNDPYAAGNPYKSQLSSMPQPVITANVSSNNKAGITKLIEMNQLPKNEKGYYSIPLFGAVVVNLVENKFGYTITNSEALAETIAKEGKLAALPAPVAGLPEKNPAVIYWDMNVANYPSSIHDLMKNGMGESQYAAFTAYAKIFKELTITGSGKDAEAVLTLSNGEGNSLYRLFAQADESYKLMKKE